MPTYSYRCENCNHEFELVQRITEDPAKDCPSCHQPRAKRQIQSGNFILKGGGWYADLYSGGSNKSTASSAANTGAAAAATTGAAASTTGASDASSKPAAPASAPAAPSSSTTGSSSPSTTAK